MVCRPPMLLQWTGFAGRFLPRKALLARILSLIASGIMDKLLKISWPRWIWQYVPL